MISESTVSQIKDAIDVKDVISDFIELRHRGTSFVACCPFHGERTPSFTVNPARNNWHCFGCGEHGNAIDFLMKHENKSYAEALEWLANKYHIQIVYEKTERSDEETEAYKRKQSMLIALKQIQDFFVEQFNADNWEAEVARAYAYKRWPSSLDNDKKNIITDHCRDIGIGYAPRDSRVLLDYIARKCISLDALKEIGIVKDGETNQYALFRDRITIPIYDKIGQVIAFTARYIGTNSDIAKYINSPTSAIYEKKDSLFGINCAYRQARNSHDYIIVEGAPDVIRFQILGMFNAVTPLGTALTENHLKQLKSCGKIVRFIPDSDPIKGNEPFSAGIKAVMNNGMLAMKCGFEVYVREIPRTEDDDAKKIKYDPDTYITSKEVYDALEDVPFVVWYAKKLFADAKTHDLQRDVVSKVSELFPFIEDKTLVELCQEQLIAIYDKPRVWKSKIAEATIKQREQTEENNTEFSDRELFMMRKHGIIIKNNMYYSPSKDGAELERLSNFILRPVFHVKHKDKSLRVFRMINEFGQEEPLEMSQKAFGSVQSFQSAVEGLGAFIWLAKQDKLNKLKEYLFAVTESAENIACLGWHDKPDFFAFANGIYANSQFIPINEVGIIHYSGKSYYLPAFSEMYIHDEGAFDFERRFEYIHSNTDSLREYVERIIKVFGDGGKIGFAWIIACMFRDYIRAKKNWFPLLNLFGIKGSGKTALAVSLASFFHIFKKDPDKLTNSSIPAISYMLKHIRNAVVVLDEYTNLLPPGKIELLKGIFGGTTQTKMNMADNAAGGMTSAPVYSGVIFCGQHKPTVDSAIFSRCVHLVYSRTSFTPDEHLSFDVLREAANRGNAHLGMEIMQHRHLFVSSFDTVYEIVRKEAKLHLGTEQIQDRILDNWVTVLTSFRVLETVIDAPFSYAELFEICMKGIRYQNDEVDKTSETSDFWNSLNAMRMVGKVIDGTHYVIKYQKSFRSIAKDSQIYDFGSPRPLLYLNWPSVQALLSNRNNVNLMKMDVGALDNYLRTSPYFLGIKQQRFKVLSPNGLPDFTIENNYGKSVKKDKVVRPKAFVFDYEALKNSTDIDLETMLVTENEIEQDDDNDAIEMIEEQTLFEQ